MENHYAINGKTHYKWAIFHSYVSLLEGNPTNRVSTELMGKLHCTCPDSTAARDPSDPRDPRR